MNIMAVDSGANILYLWKQPRKSTPYSSKPSSSSSEPQHRKKRCRICRQPSLQFLVSDDQTEKVSLWDETPVNAFGQGSESTRLPNVVKNYGKLQRKRVAGIRRNLSNTGSVSSLFNSWAPGSTRVTHLAEKNVASTRGDVQKFGAIAKEIDAAISRIESLIPSLQKLVNSVRTSNQTSIGNSGSVRNFTTLDESMLSKQVNRMLRISSDSASLSSNQRGNVRCCVHNDVLKRIAFLKSEVSPEMDYAELISENIAQTLAIRPLCLHVQRSQDPELKARGTTDRLVSLQQASSGAKSVASQNLQHIQGLRIMPSQSDMERTTPSQNNSREGIGKDVLALKPNTMNNLGESDHETISSHTSGRYMLEKSRPSSSRRKNISGVSLSKSLQYFGGSEESSVGSSSSSGGTTLESESCPSSTRTYETTSEGYESEEQRGEDNSSQAYGDLSYYSSADQYSDTSHSSLSARQSFRRGRHFELDKGVGKFRRFRNKLGKIFHHHHHHHHHHHYINDGESGYMRSFWRRLGGMFHHTRKSSDREKPKPDKLRKSVIKSTPNEKGHGGHFRALFKGLGSHLKHSKKPKDDIERLRTSIHGSMHKKAVGIKVPNSKMVKLVKKTKRPSLAVPKRIPRQ